MRPQRYIGITGFMSRAEVEAVLASADTCPNEPLIMIGILASKKTLKGELNNHPRRYPPRETWGTILPDRGRALKLVHYAADNSENLYDDMIDVQTRAGPHCQGFQVNIPWPDEEPLWQYRTAAPFTHKTLVLQVGPRAIREMDCSAHGIADRIAINYADLVDYVIIDDSGGAGIQLDPEFTAVCFEELGRLCPKLGLVVGGGLNAGNLPELLGPLRQRFPNFSIDTERGVRDSEDDLVIKKACDFVLRADQFFNEKVEA